MQNGTISQTLMFGTLAAAALAMSACGAGESTRVNTASGVEEIIYFAPQDLASATADTPIEIVVDSQGPAYVVQYDDAIQLKYVFVTRDGERRALLDGGTPDAVQPGTVNRYVLASDKARAQQVAEGLNRSAVDNSGEYSSQSQALTLICRSCYWRSPDDVWVCTGCRRLVRF